MEPSFSVVIPVYNQSAHVKRALSSVLLQSYQDIEIIVIDDGSTDQSSEIVKRIFKNDTRIHLHILDRNYGAAYARNYGISKAIGKYIAFLDADDAWKPYFLDEIISLKKNFVNYGAYASSYEIIELNGKSQAPKIKGINNKSFRGILEDFFYTCLDDLPFCTSSIVIPVGILDQIGGFPDGVNCGEDLDLFFRIALEFPIIFSSDRLVLKYNNAENRSGYKDIRIELMYALDNLSHNLRDPNLSSHHKFHAKELIANKKIMIARDILIRGRKIQAREILNACRYTKLFKYRWIITYLASYLPHIAFLSLFRLRNILRTRWRKNFQIIEGIYSE